jgi:hypothetical protein
VGVDALDGNSLAGELFELFGREMTAASGACAHCGAVSRIAELYVYRGAGAVARCPRCAQVVMVLAHARVHLDHFSLDDNAELAPSDDTA